MDAAASLLTQAGLVRIAQVLGPWWGSGGFS